MKIKIKVLPGSIKKEWVGFFGDCVKLRLNSKNSFRKELLEFVSNDFGIKKELITNYTELKSNIVIIDIPDEGYEILMSNI